VIQSESTHLQTKDIVVVMAAQTTMLLTPSTIRS